MVAIATTNMIKMIGGKSVIRGRERRMAAMRFMCMPGRSPVIVPARIPRVMGRRSWIMVQ